MNGVLCIDPGTTCLGWAFVNVMGDLQFAGLSFAEEDDIREKVKTHFKNTYSWLYVEKDCTVVRTVSECMRIRNGNYSVPPVDLMEVNIVAVSFARYDLVYPDEWKGSVPRDVEQRKTKNALKSQELQIMVDFEKSLKGQKLSNGRYKKSFAHNAWSAVGLAMSVAGRAHKGKIK